MPEITVLMPAYNPKEPEIRQAIESILNQTFTDFEFLIIDDGSTNNAESVVLYYNDSRIRYIKNPKNLGITPTLNIGLSLSQGKYIARLDSDDYSYPERLEKQFQYMEDRQDVGVLGTLVEGRTNMPILESDLFILQRYVHGCIVHSSAMIRKSILDEHNLKYNENCISSQDIKLWSDISKYAGLAIYPEVLTFYRVSPNGISNSNAAWQNKMAYLIFFDNMIQDFPCNKYYMYEIFEKFLTSTPITDIEFLNTRSFLDNVVSVLLSKVSPQYRLEVKVFILSLMSLFIRQYK